ncbi:uncharacterized protein LOC117621490 isoform X2 [Prunus dulcis]|uniref:uncharacterized protein LOC117621490 isoform X2 n=1 Tax=Prunus dulcis TaxID=3755 RepID=UPI001481FD96|nr:uncharacterized protein LOC117621490 isoform X2 [Prunus dulcis]
MAAGEDEYVYRISTAKEWEELQSSGSSFCGELEKTSGFIHLSKLNQVQLTLQNFFLNTKVDLYLLQVDTKKVVFFMDLELILDLLMDIFSTIIITTTTTTMSIVS